jgi:hypothetical protein
MVKSSLKTKLAERIQQAKLSPYAYSERKTIISQLFQAGLWYVMALWGGKDEDIKELESMMLSFLWAGQKASAHPRVGLPYLVQPTSKGGLGLIALQPQIECLSGKTM